MRSATATPSSLALCASIGPRTTSPIAQTFGRLVWHNSFTAMKPRSSFAKPTASAFSFCVFGMRPMATISLSNVSSFFAPFNSYCTRTPFFSLLMLSIFTPSSIFRPCSLVKYLKASLAICWSAAARKVGAASRMVTSAPRRFHTEPISKPITPEPITPSLAGTSVRFSAPSLSSTFTLSTSTKGSGRGTEPVATITCLASMVDFSP